MFMFEQSGFWKFVSVMTGKLRRLTLGITGPKHFISVP